MGGRQFAEGFGDPGLGAEREGPLPEKIIAARSVGGVVATVTACREWGLTEAVALLFVRKCHLEI